MRFLKNALKKLRKWYKSAKTFSFVAFFARVKIIALFFCVIIIAFLGWDWQRVLEALDNAPIKSYALTHKTQFTTSADIRAALSLEPAMKGYFSQDIHEVERKILSLSWVNQVIVRKVYPDRLYLDLFEHKPVAVWNNINFLSEKGEVFSIPEGRMNKAGLPILFGPDSEGKTVLDAWIKIKADLAARGLGLKSVAMDSRGAWRITLSNDVELRLGRGDWLPPIDRFVEIFPHIEVPEGKQINYVDLRYEHGAAVGFRPQF